ncbi:uncharacterized protein FFB14_07390 [Fusarium fujikuroi]|nr:uncharacterized protein FFB14_07390 [Fusarium fujikuroi]
MPSLLNTLPDKDTNFGHAYFQSGLKGARGEFDLLMTSFLDMIGGRPGVSDAAGYPNASIEQAALSACQNMLAWFGKVAFGEPETAHVMLAAKQALLSGLCKP